MTSATAAAEHCLGVEEANTVGLEQIAIEFRHRGQHLYTDILMPAPTAHAPQARRSKIWSVLDTMTVQISAPRPAFCRSLGTGFWGVAAERLGLLVGAAGLVRLQLGRCSPGCAWSGHEPREPTGWARRRTGWAAYG